MSAPKRGKENGRKRTWVENLRIFRAVQRSLPQGKGEEKDRKEKKRRKGGGRAWAALFSPQRWEGGERTGRQGRELIYSTSREGEQRERDRIKPPPFSSKKRRRARRRGYWCRLFLSPQPNLKRRGRGQTPPARPNISRFSVCRGRKFKEEK